MNANSGKKILIVEDEQDILETIRYNLKKEGYEVEGALSGEEALKTMSKNRPDLVILDIMLPGIDGLEVCRKIRFDVGLRDIPVIFLTAKGEDIDVVIGLEIGADDYVSKPFSPRVLLARVKSLMRRKSTLKENKGAAPRPTEALQIKGLYLHPGRFEATLDREVLNLTRSEFLALYLLASQPGWVYSRQDIVDNVHGKGYPVTERSVDVMIVGLRKKMVDFDGIETVRGSGYRFKL